MSEHVTAELVPTGDSGVPVRVAIEPTTAGSAEDSYGRESKDLQAWSHQGFVQPSTDLSMPVQGDRDYDRTSGSAGAAAVQLVTDVDSGPAWNAVQAEQQVGASYGTGASNAADRFDYHQGYGAGEFDRIQGSPAAEALHMTIAGGPTTAADRDVSQAESYGTSAAAQLSDRSWETPHRAVSGADADLWDSHHEGSTDTGAADTAARGFSGAFSSKAPEEAGSSAEGRSFLSYQPPSKGHRRSASETSELSRQPSGASGTLAGRSALLVAAKPSALLSEIAKSLVKRGARVTVAVRHTQDGHMFVKKLHSHLSPESQQLVNSTVCPINFTSQTSIRQFASAMNASDEPLDLLLLHTVETAGIKRRWYTPEGTAGTAQVGFVGPATLLRLLEPKLASSGTSVILTTTPLHRLGHVDDTDYMMTTWAGASAPDTQLALLTYARQLAEHMSSQGVTVAAVDMGPLREQPLAGSLLRKVPPMHQLLHLLLPSARDTAHLLATVAEDMLAEKGKLSGSATSASAAAGSSSLSAGTGAGAGSRMAEGTAGAGTASLDQTGDIGQQGAGIGAEEYTMPKGSASTGAGTGRAVRAMSASMGAQDGAGSEESDEPAAPRLVPRDHEGETQAFTAGEELGAHIKLLEVLMKEESGDNVSYNAQGGDSKTAGGAAGTWGGVESSAAPAGEKSMGAGSSSFAEAPAGAADDNYTGWGVLSGGGAAQQAVSGEQREGVSQGVGGAIASQVEGVLGAGGAHKSFRYLSRGLLATPLLTALDHAGRSSWLTHTLSNMAYPFYQLTAAGVVRGSMLMDWPVRAWLLAPAGAVSNFGKRLMGNRAARLLSQLQRGVPGVRGVPNSSAPQWVEVAPAGTVMDERLGGQLWQLVEESARVF